MLVTQRADWQGDPQELGDLFRVHKVRCGHPMEAVCHVTTHVLGWELRLDIGGSLHRSQVCRTHDELVALCGQWKTAMLDKGWE
jgi:hypothetical protein